MSGTRYTADHEWVCTENDILTVGITDYAQSQLGDIVYVELPDVGRIVDQGEETVVVESVKAAGDIKAPVTGEILEVNDVLNDEPELVNSEPEMGAWLFKIKPIEGDQFDNLMDETAYKALLESLA